MTGQPLLSGWRYRIVLLLGFSLWGGWQAVCAATARVGLFGIGVTLLMSAINYALRFGRWQLYLGALGHPLAWQPSLRIYLAGFALTTTPGKAGEALRGVLLKPLGVPYPQSFAAFVSEPVRLAGHRVADPVRAVMVSAGAAADHRRARCYNSCSMFCSPPDSVSNGTCCCPRACSA